MSSQCLNILERFSGSTSTLQHPTSKMLGAVGENMLQEWYQPGPGTIWSEAEVSKKIGYLQLFQRQQSALDSCIHLDHFVFVKCLQPDQAFVDLEEVGHHSSCKQADVHTCPLHHDYRCHCPDRKVH